MESEYTYFLIGVIALEKFVECVQKMYSENYSAVINRLIVQKIPCAYFSLQPFDFARKVIMDLKKNFNIDYLITITPPPMMLKI